VVTDRRGRAAVIGADGFIGGALARELGKQQVATSRFTRESPFVDDSGRLHSDIFGADTIFWLAGSIRPATVSDSADGAVTADHNALMSLLRGLDGSSGGGRRRIVTVSSGGTVYDPHAPSPHAEDAAIAPANQYGNAMLATESLIRVRSPDSVILRVSSAYGPGQLPRRGQGVIAYWLAAIAAGDPIQVLGREDVARDYIYIDDVTAALVGVHAASTSPEVVNIGSGVPTTLRELVDLVRTTVAPSQVMVQHRAGRSFDAPSTWLDISLAAQALGWKPRFDLPTGLEETWRQWNST
jgi:UDP-glucose 4-epimerase